MRVVPIAALTALLAWLAAPAAGQVVVPPPDAPSQDRPPELAPPGDALPPEEPVPPGAEPAPLPDAPPEVVEPPREGESLSDRLGRTGSVIRPPPGVDAEMVEEPPPIAVPMPVIPPPAPDAPQPNPDLAPQ